MKYYSYENLYELTKTVEHLLANKSQLHSTTKYKHGGVGLADTFITWVNEETENPTEIKNTDLTKVSVVSNINDVHDELITNILYLQKYFKEKNINIDKFYIDTLSTTDLIKLERKLTTQLNDVFNNVLNQTNDVSYMIKEYNNGIQLSTNLKDLIEITQLLITKLTLSS